MKQCPHCLSVVDDATACKICGTTLTYEPPVGADREKYVLCRETYLYYLKRYLPILLAAVVTVPLLLLSEANLFRLSSLVILLLGVAATAFERRFAKGMQWKYNYNADYTASRARLSVYILSVLAVFTAILSYII